MKSLKILLVLILVFSCKPESDSSIKIIPVDTSFFIKDNFLNGISKETYSLNGIETLCYVFTSRSRPTEHEMGPWCPRHIDDKKDKSGIWFKDGQVYDVNGHFITNLDEFYKDDEWKLYRDDGSVKYTKTKEECEAAAKPDVEEEYQNYCVECLPEYFKHQETTFIIPVTPVYNKKTSRLGRGGLGVAFNGVKFDPPAPIHAILAAHTIAPLDDHGGHVNPHGGYHYHAATGSTKEVSQKDNHSPMIGYALDGFGIYAFLDAEGNSPDDLDECGGHIDAVRGYHYHAGTPGSNQVIKCLRGNTGRTKTKE